MKNAEPSTNRIPRVLGDPPIILLAAAALVASACAGSSVAQIPRLSSPLFGTPLRYGTHPTPPPSSLIAPTVPPTGDLPATPAMSPVPGPPSSIGARWLEVEHGPGWLVYVDANSTAGSYGDRTAKVASAYMSGGRLVLDATSNIVDCASRTRLSLVTQGGSKRSVIPRTGPGAATMDFICENGERRLADHRRQAGADLAGDAIAAIEAQQR